MSLWDSINGFASGVRDTLSGGITARLCRENGWEIAEVSDGHAHIRFRDRCSLEGTRDIIVGEETGTPFIRIFCASFAVFPSQNVPTAVMAEALVRNINNPFGKWGIHVSKRGKAGFFVEHWAFAPGLDAAAFQTICASMLKEASAFDAELRQAGVW